MWAPRHGMAGMPAHLVKSQVSFSGQVSRTSFFNWSVWANCWKHPEGAPIPSWICRLAVWFLLCLARSPRAPAGLGCVWHVNEGRMRCAEEHQLFLLLGHKLLPAIREQFRKWCCERLPELKVISLSLWAFKWRAMQYGGKEKSWVWVASQGWTNAFGKRPSAHGNGPDLQASQDQLQKVCLHYNLNILCSPYAQDQTQLASTTGEVRCHRRGIQQGIRVHSTSCSSGVRTKEFLLVSFSFQSSLSTRLCS